MAWVNLCLMVFRHLPRVPLYSVVVNIMKIYRHDRDLNPDRCGENQTCYPLHHSLIKDNLKTRDVLNNVDYSENFHNNQQQEIKSAYFRNTSFSIFTACAYYRQDESEEVQKGK